MRPALFVQDIQNIWLYEPDSNKDLRDSMEGRLGTVNAAISWFRGKGLPVIVGYTEDVEGGLVQGAWRYEVPDTVRVEPSDPKVTKRHASAFGNPELGALLKSLGCDSMVIVGLSASGCVLATFFGALDFDVRPYVLKGGIASHNEEHVRFAEEICDTVDLKDLDRTFL
jgi:nicotinamidase-related amidase